MNVEVEKRELKRQIDELLAKGKLTTSEQKQADLLMAKAKTLNSHEERKSRLASAMAEVGLPNEEQRGLKIEKDFELYLRTGDNSIIPVELRGLVTENRTYVPETTQTAAAYIPQQWAGDYLARLKSFVGIREAGANVVSTNSGAAWKYPFSDDTQNDGERLNENDLVSLANPTLNITTLAGFRYTSKGVQISNELVQDFGFDISSYLQDLFAKRIGRIVNREFTLGAGSGPAGVLPSITNILPTASPTAVTVAELVALQSVDAGYLPGAVYMFSPSIERALKAMVGTDGLPVFPEMRTGKMLLGFPYVLNTAMAAAFAANAQTVVFGNFKRGVTIREVTPLVVASRERFAEFFMAYYSLTHRQDCMVTDANALAVLQQHA